MTGFPFSLSTPAEHQNPLPKSVDVVVIGGGIIGVMSALFLARSGVSVLLLEKGRIAGEQSSRNWGWVRQQGRDPAELPIMIEARKIWQGLAAETSEDMGYRETGVAYLAHRASEMEAYENWMPHAQDHGLDTRILSAVEVGSLIPNARANWCGGLWTASDGRAEPWVAVPVMARAAAKAGATIIENCAARSLDVAAGRISGVITEAGRVTTSEVVLAGGAWSSLLARAHGVDFPQLSVRASVAATAPMDFVFDGGAADRRLAFRRRADGGYTLAAAEFHEFFIGPDAFRHFRHFWAQLKSDPLQTRLLPMAPRGYPDGWGTARNWAADEVSPFEHARILNPKPNHKRLAGMARDFEDLFPQLGPVHLQNSWAGMIDTMPDLVPVVDRVDSLPGLTIATGMSGHGFGIGPAVGRIVADLVRGQDPGHDLSRFRLSRFGDGTPMKPGPSL